MFSFWFAPVWFNIVKKVNSEAPGLTKLFFCVFTKLGQIKILPSGLKR